MHYLAVMQQDIQLLIPSGYVLVFGFNLVSHLFGLCIENTYEEITRVLAGLTVNGQHLECSEQNTQASGRKM
ncbi:hypothetical protein ACU8KO_002558 [Vibrio alginolyticus]